MSNTIPERFFESPVCLSVIHEDDSRNLDLARMSLNAIIDIVSDGHIEQRPLTIDRERLAHLLTIVAERLDAVVEIGFNKIVQSRHQTQGV